MFEKFGEMDSYREINELAENLFNEGDYESIKVLAKENGIGEDFVDLFLRAEEPELCDEFYAAFGKLDVESSELKPKGIMLDWVDYIKAQCFENDKMAFAVRRKGKSLNECIGMLLKWSFENQMPIDNKILIAAGVKAGRVTLGIPNMGTAKKIIREYYLGK